MEPTVSSETSAIRTQTPGNYPKRNTLHLEHGESLKTTPCSLRVKLLLEEQHYMLKAFLKIGFRAKLYPPLAFYLMGTGGSFGGDKVVGTCR